MRGPEKSRRERHKAMTRSRKHAPIQPSAAADAKSKDENRHKRSARGLVTKVESSQVHETLVVLRREECTVAIGDDD